MNKIPKIHTSLENFIVWQGGFNEAELSKINEELKSVKIGSQAFKDLNT